MIRPCSTCFFVLCDNICEVKNMNYTQNPYPSQGYMKYQPYQPLQQAPVPPMQPYQPMQPMVQPAQQWQQPAEPAPQPAQPQQEAPVMPDNNEALAQAIHRLCDLAEALYSDYRKEVQKIWTSDR